MKLLTKLLSIGGVIAWIVIGAGLLAWALGLPFSCNAGMVDELKNVDFSFLESGQGSYFFNMKDGRNEGAVTTPLITYRWLSGDVGYSTGYDDKTVGSVLAGGQIHIEKILAETFPEFWEALYENTPASVNRIASLAKIGFAGGYNFSEEKGVYGLLFGFEKKF